MNAFIEKVNESEKYQELLPNFRCSLSQTCNYALIQMSPSVYINIIATIICNITHYFQNYLSFFSVISISSIFSCLK